MVVILYLVATDAVRPFAMSSPHHPFTCRKIKQVFDMISSLTVEVSVFELRCAIITNFDHLILRHCGPTIYPVARCTRYTFACLGSPHRVLDQVGHLD
jgi:hypothetical protein